MDASQLRSAISSLQRECSQLERENNIMQGQINDICNSAHAAACSLARSRDAAARTLDNSANVIEFSEQTLQEVTAEQEHIAVLYRGFKNIETANKRIRELNNKIYFEFANFRMVRKIVRAFIDNINLEIVSNELIYKSVEKEHLQSPDFWLSCAMLAIMHWRDNDQNAAERAIDQAMKLDDRQTMLFFMSFNLLLGRKDAALKWFDCYQQAEKTGDDAGIILLLLHATNLSDDGNDEFTKRVKKFLFEEYERSVPMNDMSEVVETIKDHLVQYNTSESFAFDTLRNHLRDYSIMSNVLTMAKDNAAIMDFVDSTTSSSRGRGYVYIEKFISELLDTPDKKERAYTDEIAYNETIIKCVGNLGDAEEEFRKIHEHAISPLNLLSECIGWLFGSESTEVSEVAKYNMFLLCKEPIKMAAEKYFREYRGQHKTVHPAAIKDYATSMNFQNKPQELNKVESFYDQKRASQLATVKNTSIIMCIVFAILCGVGGLASFICNFMLDGNGLLILMGVMLVFAAILVIAAIANYFGNIRRRKEINENADRALKYAKGVIDKLFVEHDEYLVMYDESDRIADDIILAIER